MRSLAIAALLACAPSALAQGIAPPAAGPASAAPARASGAGLVLQLGTDFGFDPLARVQFTSGRSVTVHVNDGTALGLGASFLPLAGGRLATRATAGVKIELLRASNGSATFVAFPVELVEQLYAGPLRLGLGGSLLVAPRLRGSGILEGEARSFGPAPGAIAEAEWIVSARTRTGIGVRGSWTWLSAGGVSASGPSVGLVLRADFDLAR